MNGMAADTGDPKRSRRRKEARERRVRLSFILGAERHTQESLGRPLTDEELRRIIERFPMKAGSG